MACEYVYDALYDAFLRKLEKTYGRTREDSVYDNRKTTLFEKLNDAVKKC